MSMFETFEAFADIDQLVEKLDDSDSAVRQIAVLELSDPATRRAASSYRRTAGPRCRGPAAGR